MHTVSIGTFQLKSYIIKHDFIDFSEELLAVHSIAYDYLSGDYVSFNLNKSLHDFSVNI